MSVWKEQFVLGIALIIVSIIVAIFGKEMDKNSNDFRYFSIPLAIFSLVPFYIAYTKYNDEKNENFGIDLFGKEGYEEVKSLSMQ